MARRVACLWRTFRTGLGFGVFGAGAIIVGLLVLPAVTRLPGDGVRRAQSVVHRSMRLWVWFATRLGLFTVRWNGTELLREHRPCVVVANHPTLIDIVLLISRMPQADCVVKRAAWRSPFLRWVVAGAGYIANDAGMALIDVCASRVRQGRWVVLFPEGTRSPARGLARFHRGAAHVALRSGAPLLPVVITCDPPTLMKDQPWYHVPESTARFTVQVGEPIEPERPLTAVIGDGIAARRLTAEMRAYYADKLGYARL